MIKPRIIQGLYKGKKLEIPDLDVRPITDRTKRSLFDTLDPIIEGARCLDLFCGSGTIGIEALSRGAEHVTFVDVSPRSIQVLKRNFLSLDIPKTQYSIKKNRFDLILKKSEDPYQIIFVDPPFLLFEDIDFSVLRKGMNNDSVAVLKVPKQKYYAIKEKIGHTFEIVHEKKVGINNLMYIKLKE